MKHRTYKSLLLGLIVALTINLPNKLSAQTNNSPARLAIISESSAAATVGDLLTVELSAKPQLQLLERAQIEKVYREQGLSAGNKDVLKLGQVLGADGLLLLTLVTEGTNQFMQVRLVAVKPGVVIAAVRSVWPVEKTSVWAHWLANHFDPLFPKLSVSVRDAIPISVVNLRSAVRSSEAQETERQLTLLVTERLARERDLFVLERRRMDMLSPEKELVGMGESEFWNSSYLLEGTVDRDGYSASVVTINARLLPPHGGEVMEISVSGPRTNFGEVIEQLVAKIIATLKKPASAGPWLAAEEAAKYFDEAKWAVKWGMVAEAQAAVEAAWALGARTPDVAQFLVRSYVDSMPDGSVNGDDGMHVLQVPDESAFPKLDRGLEFVLRNSPVFFGSTNSLESFTLGMRLLRQAFNQLESYYYAAEMRSQHLDDLIALRSNARRMLEVLDVQATTITNTMKRGDPRLTYAALRWREAGVAFDRPEDSLGYYRNLLFAGEQENDLPRIIGWTWPDRRRVPALMGQLVDDARTSTNPAVRLEGLFLALLLAPDDEQGSLRRAEEALESALWENREMLFQDADLAALVERTRVALTKKTQYEDIYKAFSHEPFASFKHRLRIAFLADTNTATPAVLEEFFPNTNVKMETPEQARELLPLLEALLQTPAFSKRSGYKLSELRLSAGVASQTPAPGPILEAAPVLEAKFVPWKLAQLQSGLGYSPYFDGMIYRNGHLWVRVCYLDSQQGDFGSVCQTACLSVNPQQGVTSEIPLPDQHLNSGMPFEVTGNSLFARSEGLLFEYKFRDKNWVKIPIPMEGANSLVWLAGRLFVGRADGLLSVNPETADSQVLVSSRRTPPANEIDPLWTRDTKIFPLADGQLGVWVEKNFLRFEPAAARWRIHPLALSAQSASFMRIADYHSPAGAQRMFAVSLERRYLLGFWNEGPVESLLMEESGVRFAPSTAERLLPPLRWDWPKNYPMERSQLLSEEKKLWALAPRQLGMMSGDREPVKFSDARDATLFCFTPDARAPLTAAVRFPTNALPRLPMMNGRPTGVLDPFNFEFMMKRVGNMAFWFRVPGGLVLGGPKYAGHWFIADAELEKTFAAQRKFQRASANSTALPAPTLQKP